MNIKLTKKQKRLVVEMFDAFKIPDVGGECYYPHKIIQLFQFLKRETRQDATELHEFADMMIQKATECQRREDTISIVC